MTSLSVQEIAVRTGYGDAYYFSRIFKKVTGLSPKSYRKSSKG
jgi:YesN/AraC family two-component response regulator